MPSPVPGGVLGGHEYHHHRRLLAVDGVQCLSQVLAPQIDLLVSINPAGVVSSTVPGVTAPHPDTSEAPNLLAPEPAVRTGALIGYARVSTTGQLLDRQQRALAEAGCLRVFADKLSGKDADRPELAACLDYLRPGDTLVVPSLDRLVPVPGRPDPDRHNAAPARGRVQEPARGPDTTTPGGRLVFHVFAALAEFIRELIVEGTREGLDAARTRGARLGRPPAMTAEQIRHARDLLTRPDNTVSSIARLLGVSRATIYKYVPVVTTGRQAVVALPL
jgi:DNA invertase Pin-like site-specific DNA recombinase